MKGYNVIVVFNKDADKMLMCKRVKDPYKGLSNFVGGKIEQGENGYDAAPKPPGGQRSHKYQNAER